MKSDLPNDLVYTLDDLENWPSSGTSLAVLGHPVKHSLSPPMHNAALAEMGPKFADWTYYKFDIHPDTLQEALKVFHAREFVGLNLTVPHKVLAKQWVRSGELEVDLTGACNTLLREDGGFIGYNTDLYGMIRGVETEFKIQLADRTVILLGAGGAARAAAVACAQAGVKELILANRTLSKLDTIEASLEKLDLKPRVQRMPLPGKLIADSGKLLVINATSLGLKEDDPAPADLSLLPSSTLVFDMIYNPARTALLKQAESLGMSVANGLSMLAYQGERSLKIWTRAQPSSTTMLTAALHGLNQAP